MSAESEIQESLHIDVPPPFLGTWRRIYSLVLAYLVLLIGCLALITWKLGEV